MPEKENNLTSEEMESMAKEAIVIWWSTVVKAVVMNSNSAEMRKILHTFLSSAVTEMVRTQGSKRTLDLMGPVMRTGGKKAAVRALEEHEIVDRDGIAI
ncbi:MAG: hypothetical protein MZV70_43620 [Desulfobacterales bacterium]|nr:hypothetical protein [Desulfobacterales bacterium]